MFFLKTAFVCKHGLKIFQKYFPSKMKFKKCYVSTWINKFKTETLKFVYSLHLGMYPSVALMERFLTWWSHTRFYLRLKMIIKVPKFPSLATYPQAIQGTF